MRKLFIICCLLSMSIVPCDLLFAQAEEIIPAATADELNPFVKMLEEVELRRYEKKKHWRKGDYPPYRFIGCDLNAKETRARLSYVKETEGARLEFFLVFFESFNNKWVFEFNDVVFVPELQYDGTETTLRDALKTRNKRYWFEWENIESE